MELLHPLDKQRKHWSDNQLQQYMAFCILDSNVTYKQVCKACDALIDAYLIALALREGSSFYFSEFLERKGFAGIRKLLIKAGYPWYNQKARYLSMWARGPYSSALWLRVADRSEMVTHILGISMKLASMFTRNTRGWDVAVLDRHILRVMGEELSLIHI